MAISKILHINSNSRSPGHHLKIALDYIKNGEKTQEEIMTGAINCQCAYAYEQMKATKDSYEKNSKRQAYHLIISFNEGEVDSSTAFKLVGEFAKDYLGDKYEVVYAVHDNTRNIHGHIIWNSVSFTDGKKYRYSKGDWENIIQPMVNRYCEKYNLKTLDISKTDRSPKKEWDQNKDGPFVWSNLIKRDIDACILLSEDYDMFIESMEDKGYEIKQGKYLAVKPKGMQRYRRCKTLGEEYTKERIIERIEIESLKTYRRKESTLSPRIVSYKGGRRVRANLLGLQKRYFARLYRLGKLKKRPYSQTWRYKDDIKRMHKLQEQYLFLVKNNITTVEQLQEKIEQIETEKRSISKEKRRINREYKSFEDLFKVTDVICELNTYEEYYQMGDDTFEEEHNRFMECETQLKEAGYSLSDIEKIKEHYVASIDDNRVRFNELKKAVRIAKEINTEIQRSRETEIKTPEKTISKKIERKR